MTLSDDRANSTSRPHLTIDVLKSEASRFAEIENNYEDSSLYGVTDGKAIGTYFEHKFRNYLNKKYDFEIGNSASGIDFPILKLT